jgi:AP endonuclease-1
VLGDGGETEKADAPAKKTKRTKASKSNTSEEGATAVTVLPGPNTGKTTDWASIAWTDLGQTSDGRPWNIKFSSWNVNGVRAWLKNGAFEYIAHEAPDVFCLQETKCAESALPKGQLEVEGYHSYWSSAGKPGYSGTGLYSKVEPLKVTYGMGIEKHDQEGRLITCEFEKFYFVTAYVPNAGEGLKRLDYRQEWDKDFRAYLTKLDSEKPLILCGDLNVAHNEIDLKNPKTNTKTAGFTQQERDGFTALLAEGFLDSFRQLHPTIQAFTYWSYRFNARGKNIGWRLDYFVLSERLMKDVCSCVVRSEVVGSDHCPLVLGMAMI